MKLPFAVWFAFAVIVLGLATCAVQAIKDQGRQDALKEVEDANRNSENKAQQGQGDVDRCYSAGGVWDRAHGLCAYPGSGQ